MTAAFRSDFDSRYVGQREGRPAFRLLAPLVYYSEHLRREVVVPEGFITDLASVPRWIGAYLIAGGKAVRSAVVHDWLYASGEVAREDADAVFREAMDAENDPEESWRRWLMWKAVRAFGWSPYGTYRKADGKAEDAEPEASEQPIDPSPGG